MIPRWFRRVAWFLANLDLGPKETWQTARLIR